jgi:hypothetical protein
VVTHRLHPPLFWHDRDNDRACIASVPLSKGEMGAQVSIEWFMLGVLFIVATTLLFGFLGLTALVLGLHFKGKLSRDEFSFESEGEKVIRPAQDGQHRWQRKKKGFSKTTCIKQLRSASELSAAKSPQKGGSDD